MRIDHYFQNFLFLIYKHIERMFKFSEWHDMGNDIGIIEIAWNRYLILVCLRFYVLFVFHCIKFNMLLQGNIGVVLFGAEVANQKKCIILHFTIDKTGKNPYDFASWLYLNIYFLA